VRGVRKMLTKKNGRLFAIGIILSLAGCGSVNSGFNVSQYFGKSEQQIIEMLGEPSGEGRPSFSTRGNLTFVIEDPDHIFWLEEKLSPPLTLLQVRFSESRHCNQVLGTFQPGYKTPEEVLEAIGFGSLEKERTSSGQLGFNYKMPPFESVHVYRPSSNYTKYTDFILYDKEAGNPM